MTPQTPTATRMLPEISLSYKLQNILAPFYPTLGYDSVSLLLTRPA